MAWWQKFDSPAAAWLRRVIMRHRDEGSPKPAVHQYISPEVVTAVTAAMRGRGGTRQLTVLFSNIRGFTTVSERLEPRQVVEQLNAFFVAMTESVSKHGGIIDKFIGDGMLVLYNAPLETRDHAFQAVQTALELQERARDFSRRFGRPIRFGVGISTGDAFVGNIGSKQRMQYGAVGYTVNLASRLEGLTEEYNAPIVISETTHQHLAGRIPTRELGDVVPQDMTRPVKIFGVLTSGGER